MSFLYPRTVDVYRPQATAGVGNVGYVAPVPSTDKLIASGISASIQLKKEVGSMEAKLPGDTTRRTYWRIICQAALGTIKDRDVLVDDQGIRYQVTAAYWNSLGYQCLCERLEA